MKRITLLIMACLMLCAPASLYGQKRDDTKYLKGAVPEVDGKVVFARDYSIPGMSQEEIYSRALTWMEARLKKNENTSRVVYKNPEEGQIVGLGQEWIVFSSSALSLDRTEINYQLTFTCEAEKCRLEVEKVKYNYREGKEKYTAEEWITDKYALNKAQTKLVRGLAKWRRKTVDFADAQFEGLTTALNLTQAVAAAPTATNMAQPVTQPAAPKVIPATPLQPAVKVEQPAAPSEIAPAEVVKLRSNYTAGRWVIVIGEEPFNMTMMTANAGGSMGMVNGKPMVFTILSPDQNHDLLDKATSYSVRFYPTGASTPTLTLECIQAPAPQAIDGMPRTYVGEIVKAKKTKNQ